MMMMIIISMAIIVIIIIIIIIMYFIFCCVNCHSEGDKELLIARMEIASVQSSIIEIFWWL